VPSYLASVSARHSTPLCVCVYHDRQQVVYKAAHEKHWTRPDCYQDREEEQRACYSNRQHGQVTARSGQPTQESVPAVKGLLTRRRQWREHTRVEDVHPSEVLEGARLAGGVRLEAGGPQPRVVQGVATVEGEGLCVGNHGTARHGTARHGR
jgi:hypothetical protein